MCIRRSVRSMLMGFLACTAHTQLVLAQAPAPGPAPAGNAPPNTAQPSGVVPGAPPRAEPGAPGRVEPSTPGAPQTATQPGSLPTQTPGETAGADGSAAVGVTTDAGLQEDDEVVVGGHLDEGGEPVDAPFAAAPSAFEARVGLGFALPTLAEDFTDTYHPGGHLQAEGGLSLAPFHVALVFNYAHLLFNRNPILAELTSNGGGFGTGPSVNADGGALDLYQLFLQGRWDLAYGELAPYLLGGGGIAIANPRELTVTVSQTDTMGNTQTTTTSRNDGTEVDPMLTLGVGASAYNEWFNAFAQLRADVLFADEITPIVMLTVGMGI